MVGSKTLRKYIEVIKKSDAISYVEEIVFEEDDFLVGQIKNSGGNG